MAKAALNAGKHGIFFADAAAVLDDPAVVTEEQVDKDDERTKLIGVDDAGRLLAVVVSIGWPSDEDGAEEMGFIRIISARRATPAARRLYAP